jgi:hypothetical protein
MRPVCCASTASRQGFSAMSRSAQALGLTIPEHVLLQATEVIQ